VTGINSARAFRGKAGARRVSPSRLGVLSVRLDVHGEAEFAACTNEFHASLAAIAGSVSWSRQLDVDEPQPSRVARAAAAAAMARSPQSIAAHQTQPELIRRGFSSRGKM